MERKDIPLVYIDQDSSGLWDVYRCENGYQAWNVIQDVTEAEAREVQALVNRITLRKLIDREISRLHEGLDETPDDARERIIENRVRDIARLVERANLDPVRVRS